MDDHDILELKRYADVQSISRPPCILDVHVGQGLQEVVAPVHDQRNNGGWQGAVECTYHDATDDRNEYLKSQRRRTTTRRWMDMV